MQSQFFAEALAEVVADKDGAVRNRDMDKEEADDMDQDV
jgi:hypothetical protein